MQERKSVHRRRSRQSRRLATEALESRQLMAADFGMLGSTGVPAALLARIQDSGVDVSAMVSKFRSGGITSQQQMAIRQQLAANPAAQALIQQRMQAAMVQAELTPVSTQPAEVVVNEVESAEQVEPTSETTPREAIRARVAERVSDRFDGEVPVELQERIAARREGGSIGREGGPLSRLRALAERNDIEPSDFVVRDADGNVDRAATRANVRERFEDSELADNIRQRVSDRFDGEVPVELQERIAARRESGSIGREGGPLSRLRALAERNDIEPSDFVVRDADGNVDREATRANFRERFEDSELADNIRQRVSDRFDGEVPVELQERIAERRESGSIGREGGPLSRLRALAERNDIEPSDFVVRDADGNVDREATRANVREHLAGSELADNIRQRVSDRFDGEVPVELQERIAARISTPIGVPTPASIAPESVVQVVASLGRQDVNRDGALSPLDVLLVINGLNQGDSDYSEVVDVNGDGLLSPVDALLVVNALNGQPAAEVESPAPLREAATDSFFGGEIDEDDEEGIFSLGFRPRMRLRG